MSDPAAADPRIRVELVFSPMPGAVRRIALDLPQGATVAAALRLARARPEDAVPADLPTGVYGQAVSGTTVLVDGDRLELYRPLSADPKDARRERVQRARRGA